MEFLSNISIRKRLMMICTIFITILVGFGFFGILQMQELANLTQSLYENNLQVSNAAIEARANILRIRSKMKSILATYNQAEIKEQIEEIGLLNQVVDEQLEIVKTHTTKKEIAQMEKELGDILIKWRENQKSMSELALKGRNDLAAILSKTRDEEFMQQLDEKLGQMDEAISASTNEVMAQTNKLRKSHRGTYILWMTIFCGISFIMFICIIRSIIYPITLLKNTMSNSATTGALTEAEIKGKNEIADMAIFYNALVKKRREQFWIKDNQNLLNEELWGDISLNELAQKTINFLARTIGAGNGVFYIYDQDSKVLNLQAAFALTEKNKLSNRYELGEGIVGQVAMEKKPILLKNVIKQESIIATGTCSGKPLNIYAFPLVYEDELYGVIELSSFEQFEQLKQEYLGQVSRIVSINLYSILQNDRIKELLVISEEAQKEVKKTAEDLQEANQLLEEQQLQLQQQTVELQQTNVELEEQQQQLQQQSEELQQTNIQLEEQQQMLEEQSKILNSRNQELEKSKEELYNRTAQLEQANKYKSEFLANMSHELRTPLNSIILLSKLMFSNEDSMLPEKELEKIKVIYNSGQELLRLINDILDLSKIEAGRMDLNISKFHSNELVVELKELFTEVAQEKNIRFHAEDSVDSKLIGDREKISQILRNLLSNAIKFTEEGSVTLDVIANPEKENSIVFSVADTGVGISKEKLTEIFEEFKQGDGSISRKYGGTGLGLSISKKLSELMGGEIRVISKEGQGSTFSLYLNNVIVDSTITAAYEEAAVASEPFNKDSEGIESKPKSEKTILIIEDDINFAEYIRQVNDGMGFDTLIASTGRLGLELVQKYKVDGILLDLMLPDMAGIEVLRELKSIAELRSIPVHIISANDKDIKTQKMGAIGFYQKTLDANDIARLISQVVAFTDKKTKSLLVIEGDKIQRDAVKELIRNENIHVVCVDCVEKAKFELSKKVYDAVILDLQLKDGDGIDICKFIHKHKINVPVIIYTERELTTEQEKILNQYADSIIIKTADSDERLLDEVTLFLHKVRKTIQDKHYLYSKTNEQYVLNLSGRKILIADDDARNIFVLASALENYDAEIIEAENGKVALEKLVEHNIDLILVDVMMPVMDGYETIKEVRKNEKLKHIPIIAVTAKTLKGDREKCIEAGANDYIAKPVDYDVLIRLVKAWIDKSISEESGNNEH